MRLSVLLGLVLSILSFSPFAAECPESSDAESSGSANGTSCTVTGTQSTIELSFVSGFSDASTLSAIDGNNGTTLGAQRKLSFIKAAEIISESITSSVTIIIDAEFSELTCNAGSAVLGSAGPTGSYQHPSPPTGIPASTWAPLALYNAKNGSDAFGAYSDITSNFNSDIGDADCLSSSNGWYYGYSTPGANYIGFVTVLLHEITHGLGFLSLVDPSSGAWGDDGAGNYYDDVYSDNLYDSTNGDWSSLSNGQRATSSTSVTGLLWNGASANLKAQGLLTDGFNDVDTDGTFESGDRIEMYAPASVESGSSLGHFTTDAAPNELMEPSYTDPLYTLGLALYLLEDIGWSISANTTPAITAVDQSTNEDTAKTVDASGWGSDGDGDTLTYSVDSACATNITCSIDTNGQNFTMTPAANHNGGSHSITVTVSDGNGGTASDTLNLNVVAQNDAPSWSAISTQNVTIGGSSIDINLSTYASDQEGDSLSYSEVSCGTGLTCSISSSTLTLTGVSNGGATVAVEIQADDGNSGQTNVTFSVNINAANSAPIWSAIPNQSHTIGDAASLNLNSYATDADGDSMTYSGCGSTSICSISGNTLTINTSSADSESITLTADDSNGGSTDSSSFSISISAANTAPVLTNPGDQSIELGSTLNFTASASDAENDGLTYSLTAATAAGASNVGAAMSFSPTQLGSFNITIQVTDDGAGALSDSETFTLTVFEVPDIELDGNALNPNDTNNIDNIDVDIDISSVSDSFSYSLDFEGNNADSLIETSGDKLSISMPSSGQFAGSYTLTVTDSDTGNTYDYTFVRSPRLNFSASQLLAGMATQTLIIEGGIAGTVYTLTSSESSLTFIINESNVTEATAINDSDAFNPATLILSVGDFVSSTNLDITASSIYEDANSTGISIEPSRVHSIVVEDTDNNLLNQASVTLNTTNLSTFNLEQDYLTNASGEVLVTLPDDDNDYSVEASYSGLSSASAQLLSTVLEQTITLDNVANPVLLTGNISAASPLSFNPTAPIVTLILQDDSEVNIPVSLISNSSVSFNYTHDLNNGELKTLVVSHVDGVDLSINLLTRSNTFEFDILLNAQSSTTVVIATSESGAGGMGWLILLIISLIINPSFFAKKELYKRYK